MASEAKNYYEVLGIERDADERAIKKAYFGLVRKYPPETHPEEFKKIREAYEVLSNPQSRADYDSVSQYDQYGAEVKAAMQAGMDAMDQGDWRTAQTHFHEVLRLQPNLYYARDLLGMAYLNNEQAEEALAQFEALIEAQPDNHVYHLHKGYAHYHVQRYAAAMDAFRKAAQLDETDTRALVAMADTYAAQKHYEQALDELDKAINMDGQVDFQDFIFFMRKVQIQLLRNRADLAEQDLDQIFKILPDDEETRKYVATRLASLAADLFAMKRSVDGNRLLQRCRALDPSRKSMEFQFPSKVTLPIAELPPASQDWIANHGNEWAAGKLSHNMWGGPIFLLIVAVVFNLVMLSAAFGAKRLWSSGTRAQMALLLVGAPLLLGLGIRRVRRVAKSRYGKYTTIHPLHLAQVNVDQVTLWPLVNLHDVSLTHHSTNGVYQYTAVRMDFAGTICNLTIRGQQASVDWANQLLAQRRRVLELMSMGLLDAEEGFDMVPPEQMTGAKKAEKPDPARRKQTLAFYGSFAAAGVLLAGIAIPYNIGAAERSAWRACTYYPTISEYRRYLELFPTGKHAAEAQRGIADKYDEAIARYKERATQVEPTAMAAVVGVIEALKTSPSHRVKVTFEPEVDFSATKSLDSPEFADVIPADEAFSPSYNRARQYAITSALRRSFGEMFTHDVIDFDDDSYDYDFGGRRRRVQATSPVTFAIKYHVGPSGTIYESTTGAKKKLFGILFGWDFAIRFDGEDTDRYHLTMTSSPAKNIRYTTYGDFETRSEIVPYTKMAESAFEEFGRKLAQGFGVHIAGPGDDTPGSGGYGSAYGGTRSPAVQKILDDLKKNGRMSPETQRLLEDIRRRRQAH